MKLHSIGIAAIVFSINIYFIQGSVAEEWICSQESSVRRGNEYLACGVAVAPTENLARRKALLNAKQEFHEICSESKDCRSRKKDAEPLRTTCRKLSEGQIKCFRGVRYTLLNEKDEGENLKELLKLRDERLKILEEEVKIRRDLKRKAEKIARLEKMIKEDNYQDSVDEEEESASGKVSEQVLQDYQGRLRRFQTGWWVWGLTYATTVIVGLSISEGEGSSFYLIPFVGPIIQIVEDPNDSDIVNVLSGVSAAVQVIGIGVVLFNIPGPHPQEVALIPEFKKNSVAFNAVLRF